MNDVLKAKELQLIDAIEKLESVMVAYSGGVDSSTLAFFAKRTLGAKALIVIAVSPSLAQDELRAAREQAQAFQWNLLEINTDEVSLPEYQRNDEMRCYFCKSVLFDQMDIIARARFVKHLAYGANVDDLADFRPGHRAAQEHKVVSPLQSVGLTKEEIRQLAKANGLFSWDRPQAACLSSRFPKDVPITTDLLSQVDSAEQVVKSFSFKQVRVRHHGSSAVIEVDSAELIRLIESPEIEEDIKAQLKQFGYLNVAFDPQGYRQGSLNASWTKQITLNSSGRTDGQEKA